MTSAMSQQATRFGVATGCVAGSPKVLPMSDWQHATASSENGPTVVAPQLAGASPVEVDDAERCDTYPEAVLADVVLQGTGWVPPPPVEPPPSPGPSLATTTTPPQPTSAAENATFAAPKSAILLTSIGFIVPPSIDNMMPACRAVNQDDQHSIMSMGRTIESHGSRASTVRAGRSPLGREAQARGLSTIFAASRS
jgi:hypothetical protein